jgi:predicted RNase H-like HicB family nuclease
MAKISLSGTLEHKNQHLAFKLGMYIFQEEGAWIVYCPALDLSSYGDTEEQAKQAFGEVLSITLHHELNRNTFIKDLQKHGWSIKSKEQSIVHEPSFNDLLKNETFRDILNNKEYSYRRSNP